MREEDWRRKETWVEEVKSKGDLLHTRRKRTGTENSDRSREMERGKNSFSLRRD